MEFTSELLDKLYAAFRGIYGDKYHFSGFNLSLLKTIYESALRDLTREEIRNGLRVAKRYSHKIPSIVEFWHWCKNIPYHKREKEKYSWRQRKKYVKAIAQNTLAI